jgi:hypothetical protein
MEDCTPIFLFLIHVGSILFSVPPRVSELNSGLAGVLSWLYDGNDGALSCFDGDLSVKLKLCVCLLARVSVCDAQARECLLARFLSAASFA